MHPSAAIAIKELVEENPHRNFVNFAPDSDWERPTRVRLIKDAVKNILSPNYDCEDFGAPFKYDNLHHIVLNLDQKETFTDKYGVAKDKVFDLPDHNHFDSPELKLADTADKGFIEYLRDNCVYMKDGEILVVPSTSVDYVAVMKKAKAIVTEVGGLTCHAAIVSRELKKPCVVNTLVATKIFKTGDLLRVDARKGIVKKI